MVRISLSKLFSIVFRLICTFALIVHVTIINVQYLQYETTTSVFLYLPRIIESPALSVCFKFIDLIDIEWIDRTYGTPFTTKLIEDNGNDIRTFVPNLTLDQLFRYTPPADQVYEFADFRDTQTFTIKRLDKSMARQMFAVDRFATQDLICYRIQPQNRMKYHFKLVARSENIGMLYTFAFTPEIANLTTFFIPIIHNENEYPYLSIIYSPTILHSIAPKWNVYRVLNQKMIMEMLPHPYKTECNAYESESGRDREYYINHCSMRSTIDQLNFIPYSEFKLESLKEKFGHLNVKHTVDFTHNLTQWSVIKRINRVCERLYRKHDCKTYFYITQMISREKWGKTNGLIFRVGQPMSPTVHSVYQPVQDFYTYAILALSCFGVWLGWSMIDFNPVDWILHIKTRAETRAETEPVLRPKTRLTLRRSVVWRETPMMSLVHIF